MVANHSEGVGRVREVGGIREKTTLPRKVVGWPGMGWGGKGGCPMVANHSEGVGGKE